MHYYCHKSTYLETLFCACRSHRVQQHSLIWTFAVCKCLEPSACSSLYCLEFYYKITLNTIFNKCIIFTTTIFIQVFSVSFEFLIDLLLIRVREETQKLSISPRRIKHLHSSSKGYFIYTDPTIRHLSEVESLSKNKLSHTDTKTVLGW